MDELDHNLFMAWTRVFERCRNDPKEARRRYDRMYAGGTYDRPNRAFCVAIRAGDTRIGAGDWGFGVEDEQALRAQEAHDIVLDGGMLQKLGGAVRIDYPGVPIDEAASMLGRNKESLRYWLASRPGRTRGARSAAAKGAGLDDRLVWQEHPPTEEHPLGVRYEPQRIRGRGALGGGMETPVVWSECALDPGAAKGRPPSRWWGTIWMSLAQKIPTEFEQVVRRVPRFVPYPEKDGVKRARFRGWWWVCPGLCEPDRDGTGICGRQVMTLYAPLPVWTVGRALGIEDGLEVEGLSGAWLPGVMDRWAGRRSLACERCWKVRRSAMINYIGWNELVTCLTGGLLYGREVEQPSGFAYKRLRAYRRRKQHKARRRDTIDRPSHTGVTGVG